MNFLLDTCTNVNSENEYLAIFLFCCLQNPYYTPLWKAEIAMRPVFLPRAFPFLFLWKSRETNAPNDLAC